VTDNASHVGYALGHHADRRGSQRELHLVGRLAENHEHTMRPTVSVGAKSVPAF
jgi:hypothetical protein